MSRYLADRLERIANVSILVGAEVRELIGDKALEAVSVTDHAGGRSVVEARAMFIFVGVAPCTGWLSGVVTLDQHGFVQTGHDADVAAGRELPEATRQRSMLETSQPGLFPVGGVRSGSTKRVAAAVGERDMAIRLAFERMQQAKGGSRHAGDGLYQV
jgi:thioredoxin reductase (NADPH)